MDFEHFQSINRLALAGSPCVVCIQPLTVISTLIDGDKFAACLFFKATIPFSLLGSTTSRKNAACESCHLEKMQIYDMEQTELYTVQWFLNKRRKTFSVQKSNFYF